MSWWQVTGLQGIFSKRRISINSFAKKIFKFLIDVGPHERLKVFLLTISFFCIIGAYTIAKELKDSIFINVVGREYVPWAKMLSIIILIPAILFYAKLVDRLRRYQLVYFYTIVYGIVSLICAYFIGHPIIGLSNTDPSPYRIFGWFFYFFIEGFSPFVVNVFWAFTNSITSPEAAKSDYTLIIAGSKLGGMLSASISILILGAQAFDGSLYFSDVINHQILLLFTASALCIVPFFVYLLIKKVPGRYLHGYEVAYQIEKKRATEKEGTGFERTISGFIALIKYPYMLGIFGMLFFYEVINVVFGYERLGVGLASSSTISGTSLFLLEQQLWVHFIGLCIVLFGARPLINTIGEKWCLLLVPVSTGILLTYFLFNQSSSAVLIVFVAVRSINYAFANPLRESLYIPTVKDLKFKSRSWIDAFGSKIAKASGSTFNILASGIGGGGNMINSIFFAGVIGLWTATAYFMGRRYERAIKHNEVIGKE